MALVNAGIHTFVAERLRARNTISRALFEREADRLALACEQMADRFIRGGRLLAFGRGACATDAQHVAVEFVHPVIVGKRALPALDLSADFERLAPAVAGPDDIVMGFARPEGDGAVAATLSRLRSRGAFTFALPGADADFAIPAPASDPFVTQELIEVLYHTLWETVHVFFEHRERRHEDVGASAFLYPFLGSEPGDPASVRQAVASSIRAKAAEDERLRERTASAGGPAIAAAIAGVADRLGAGGTLLFMGNGGSASDANDWALDCADGPPDAAIRAVSLSSEPASITAIANDVGADAIFLRQLLACGRRGDVAVAISTSGGSANLIAALREARSRGMGTVALLGYDGGEIVRRGLADFPIVVDSDEIPRIQEVQASIYHVMTQAWRACNGSEEGHQPRASGSERATGAERGPGPPRATV